MYIIQVLLVPGRIFIRDGVLWKVCRKGPKKRHFFLFNDTLVYGTVVSRGHYGNQHIMALSSMSVSPDCHYMPQVNLEGDHDDKDAQSPSELSESLCTQDNYCVCVVAMVAMVALYSMKRKSVQ